MSSKTNLRSFRYSDEVAGVLEAYQGGCLNEKFENLVLHCFWERKRIDAAIDSRTKQLAELDRKIEEKRNQLYEYDNLFQLKKKVSAALSAIVLDAVSYQEKVKAVTQTSGAAPGELEQDCVTKKTGA